jgi:hypothetical protein
MTGEIRPISDQRPSSISASMRPRHNELAEHESSEQRSSAYYRTEAARARSYKRATTSGLKQYLEKIIARCERLAGEVEQRPCHL